MEKQVWSVSELTQAIKSTIEQEDRLANCWVRGEISNFTLHGSGHMYFTLKDSGSRIRAIMFASRNRYLKFIPKEGMKVVIRGQVSVFERDGAYQLYAEEMQPDGIGSLYLAFQQLKERLEQEGLFSPHIKKPIPAFPRSVGVITSPTGAAVRDIVTTIRRRYPLVSIVLFPVVVQGPDAPSAIAHAIEQMNLLDEAEVLIVGRGGGSLEELWAFNEEVVARAIYASQLPIISAVGHETDVTIADFVADVRAATPTAAAELAVPHIQELLDKVESWQHRLRTSLTTQVNDSKRRLERLEQSSVLKRPGDLIRQQRQVIDQLDSRIRYEVTRSMTSSEKRLASLTQRLTSVSPVEKTKRMEQRLAYAVDSLLRGIHTVTDAHEHRFVRTLDKLDAYSPLQVLKRGYSLTYLDASHSASGKAGPLVRKIDQVSPGDRVHVRLQDGWLDCQVWGIEEETERDDN